LHDRRAGERHRGQKDCRGWRQCLARAAIDGGGSLDDIWITADFKETQLRLMKPGDRVLSSVDAYGREYCGKVTGIGGASGSRLNLLPPESATGNFVKVVQRIPVRIDVDPNQNSDHRLRPGMSVEPKVYVQ
jgi:membrane fusion protein, multidrug efflux system